MNVVNHDKDAGREVPAKEEFGLSQKTYHYDHGRDDVGSENVFQVCRATRGALGETC